MNKRTVSQSYRLSPMQHGMIIQSLLAPRSGVYITQQIIRTREDLDISIFMQAWEATIRRHSALRTAFVWDGLEEPLQQVHDVSGLPLRLEDWRGLPATEQEACLKSFLIADRKQGFSLDLPPLMRLAVFHLRDSDFRIVWTYHHALMDGRSRLLVLKDLFSLYEAFLKGMPVDQAPYPQYRAYIDWLDQRDESGEAEFWREMINGFTSAGSQFQRQLHIADHQADQYGEREVILPRDLTAKIRAYASSHNVTVNIMVQAVWAMLLSRYTGGRKILFGATRACRKSCKNAGSIVGLLVNTVPVGVEVAPERSVPELLKQLNARWRALRNHHHSSLAKIQEWCSLPNGFSLFETIVNFDNYEMTKLLHEEGGNWPLRDFRVIGHTNYPLSLIGYLSDELYLKIQYDRMTIGDRVPERMLGHFQVLLQTIVMTPTLKVGSIDILTEEEKRQLHEYGNRAARGNDERPGVVEMIEQYARTDEDRIAIVEGERRISYGELNRRAGRLGNYLRARRVGAESLVGICLDRGIEMVAAMLGILKAGAGYVPLDADYPKSRLEYLIEEAGLDLVLTRAGIGKGLPACRAELVCLEAEGKAIDCQEEENLEPKPQAESLAYLIFTSGSTGKPKGVAVTHRGVSSLVKENNCVEMDESHAVMQAAPVTFDASTFEIWGALANGAKLVIYEGNVPEAGQIGELIRRQKVTTMWLTASLYNTVIKEQADALKGLKQLLIGGEALSVRYVKEGQGRLEGTQIINGYGPTESTTFTCCYRIGEVRGDECGIPIGKAVAGREVYILDEEKNLQAVGIGGELYIAGAGLARGYYGRPDLTAERFIPNPHSQRGGERIYQSGDVARRRPDGEIDFVGRQDNQVKIRGFRIELGEIERVLEAHESVREAVVLAVETTEGADKRLVAYLIPRQIEGFQLRGVQAYVAERLPSYMAPSIYKVIEAAPLTPNGKVDRKRLPKIDWPQRGNQTHGEPHSPIEEILLSIWGEALGIESLRIDEDFFEMGGHSLTATRVISRVRQAFKVELTVGKIFERRTIRELAKEIEGSFGTGFEFVGPLVAPLQRNETASLSFAQKRLWFVDQLEPGNNVYNVPIGIWLEGKLNAPALIQSFEEVMRRHEAIRTIFPTLGGEPVQRVESFRRGAMAVIDLSGAAETDREVKAEEAAEDQARRPFDLARGPLIRAALIAAAKERHLLILTMHHIVSDGWSIGVLLRELSKLYEAFIAGKRSSLAELKIQYSDFANWQQEWLDGPGLDRQFEYWTRRLEGISSELGMPMDRPRPAIQTFSGGKESFKLPATLSQALKRLSRREGVTIYMTLLGAYQELLSQYCGRKDIVVGTPIANRNREELEELIGFFVNAIIMRIDLSSNPTFKDVLTRVREVSVGGYAHQDLPFEKLVERLQPERSLNRSPLFQVMFVLQNAPEDSLNLPGLSVRRSEIELGVEKYDQTLVMREAEGQLTGVLRYNTDLFDRVTIKQFVRRYVRLLENAVAEPSLPISFLGMLTGSELQQILVEWNPPAREDETDQCLHFLIGGQAEKSPDRVALQWRDEQLSYGELDRRATQLARVLRTRGVGPEVLVVSCIRRSAEMIVGLYGILKAGGAYLPLDPEYPEERRRFILKDAQAPVILTETSLSEKFGLEQGRVVCLDSEWPASRAGGGEETGAIVSADNLAYVIYTSGSTGKPKGVQVTHRGVCNLAAAQASHALGSKPEERVLQFASSSFDASVWEIVMALCTGSTLRLLTNEETKPGQELIRVLQEDSITTATLPPTILKSLPTNEFPTLSTVISAGEACAAEIVSNWSNGRRFFNAYGPTETSVCATMGACSVEDERPTIGRPLDYLQVYLMDENSNAAPIGLPGEIFIGGEGLSRGYLHQPGLTAEKFVPNPFRFELGSRLYKTGDLARYSRAGAIEFLGRIDHQVKVRGYRIELEEIEFVLSRHPSVAETVVSAHETADGDMQLAAYVVPEGPKEIAVDDLRRYLEASLPRYMVPAAFVRLDALPLTPNGKVDRRALPAPDRNEWRSGGGEMEAGTPVEEVLRAIWSHVLRLDRIGLRENFFDLGGHSLLAMRVISRIREAFGVEAPVRKIFESPTIAELSREIVAIRRGEIKTVAPALCATAHDRELPLSFAQGRLWFLDQLESGSGAYNIPMAIRMEGPLNVVALLQSLTEIVRRHESLRTVFPAIEGKPTQVIVPETCFPIDFVDLQSLSPEGREVRSQDLLTAQAQLLFDLNQGPLVRALLVRLAGDDNLLIVTMHHMVSDGWSQAVFFRELSLLYAFFSVGAQSPMSELVIQYADYASWQQNWLQGEILDQRLRYWKEQLKGIPPETTIPTDRPRRPAQTYRGAVETMRLPEPLSKKLKEFSQRESASLYMVLLAAFKVTLANHSGQRDLAVGLSIANRNQVEVEPLIGFFVNTLTMRTSLDGNPDFVQVLRRVRETAFGAYDHQDLPFEKLVEELRPERNLSRHPLFQIMFTLQNVAVESLEWPGLTISGFQVETEAEKFDLTVAMKEGEHCLTGTFGYNVDLFDSVTIKRLIRRYATLLENVVASPSLPISALGMLTETEHQQILVEWNQSDVEYETDSCLPKFLSRQVGVTPDAVAVEWGDEQLTYRELDRRATQLADFLQTRGVGPEVPVALCVHRSAEMIVGLLGILKAGGAYLPLDPEYPKERLAFILNDARAPVILTERSLREKLCVHEDGVVCLDNGWEAIEAEGRAEPAAIVGANSLAYVIYTSGSTGKPKGVQIEHRSLINFLRSMERAVEIDSAEVLVALTTLSFDIAGLEMFLPLIVGAKVAGAGRDQALDPQQLSKLLETVGATVMQATPTTWRSLLDGGWERGKYLKMLCGGEILPRDLASRLIRHGSILWNLYGPTETTIWSSIAKVEPGDGAVSLGRPIDNTHLYILSEQMRLAAVGCNGELHIGGEGLGRGYLNQPGLTAEKFIPNPFGARPGSRLYRTGDLCRYQHDGKVEFLGRIDNQVKLRGYRIELGEIESALQKHDKVRNAVAIIRDDEGFEKQLVAYVVSDGRPAFTEPELRSYLKEQLPEYMAPTAFVMLESLPLTPNGKVDRRALPMPKRAGRIQERYVAPRTAVEELLCGIWSQVLNVERVGIDESFFDLGGHSLIATQIISRVREVFRIEMAVRKIFESPTIAELAREIEALRREGEMVKAPPLRRGAREESLPLSFAQRRLWFLDQLEPGSGAYNIVQAYQLEGRLNITALAQSFREIVRRHQALRTIFPTVKGEPIQKIVESAGAAAPLIDISGMPAAKGAEITEEFIRTESERPFELARGPLFRYFLVRLEQNSHLLALTIHHIVSDAWSTGVFFKELARLYEAFGDGSGSPLTELEIQYCDFALWQRQWLQGEALEQHLGYWRQHLKGMPDELSLPTDRPRQAAQSYRGAIESFRLSKESTRRLNELNRRASVSLYITLLAAFKLLLKEYSGQQDIIVGSPIANRNRAEVEPLIGFFVNVLVMRSNLEGNLTVLELLRNIREVALGAYEHQDLPFEKLVEELEPERVLARTPIFQVMLGMQNAATIPAMLGALRVEPAPIPIATEKFDLTFTLRETEEGIVGGLRYKRELFDDVTIKRMVRHYERLLEEMVAGPGRRISELRMLSEAERKQLLEEWNITGPISQRGLCIHELIEEQAERTPDLIAVVYEDRRLSYGELNRRANQLAERLINLGVGAEVRVALYLERSVEMIVAMLAVLKAGGAYVPLSPDQRYPSDRLAYLLDDSGTAVIITQERFQETLPQTYAIVVLIDSEWNSIGRESGDNPTPVVIPLNLVYVIYTSGSTGSPKGVGIEHRQLANYATSILDKLRPSPGATYALVSTMAADLGNTVIFPSLIGGGALHIISHEKVADGQALGEYFEANDLDYLKIVPSHLSAAHASGSGASVMPQKALVLGGEASSEEWVRQLQAKNSHCRIINHYGPTETTVGVLTHEIRPDLRAREGEGVPLGRPIADICVYIVNDRMEPAPVGVLGEICIGGAAVSRGYLNGQEATAERFIPNTFGQAGGRLYRTGDLGRRLANGDVSFAGRMDYQVKIRGFRVELGEIELALAQHPNVRKAVVLAREDARSLKRLVAYIELKDDFASGENELRAYLSERLHDYAIPSLWIFLDRLPLTANGKIDRRRLPEPEPHKGQSIKGRVAPRNLTEELAAGIWCQLLDLEAVGVEDNFFDIGGHSLVATQVISRVREAFDVELSLESLFRSSSLAAFAQEIESSRESDQQIGAPALLPALRNGSTPLSFAQKRLWFLNQLEPDSNAYNTTKAFQLDGQLNTAALAQSLREIVRRHEALRTIFPATDCEEAQAVICEANPYFCLVDLSAMEEDKRKRLSHQLAHAESCRSFDLKSELPLRATLFRSHPEEHVFVLAAHHIVTDDWSRGIFFEEMSELYSSFRLGVATKLDELLVQYADFALWQRDWLKGPRIEKSLEFWRGQLTGAPTALTVQADLSPRAGRAAPAEIESASFSAALSAGLRELSRQETVSLYMTMLAAFEVLLCGYTGQTDIVVGSPVAHRNRVELEKLIGFFVNTLVLRTDLGGDPTFRDLLHRLRRTVLNAHANQDLPFEKLVEDLRPDRKAGQNPFFQIVFDYHRVQTKQPNLPGLTLSPVMVEVGAAKFDLELYIVDTGDSLAAGLIYNSQMFARATAKKIIENYEIALNSIAADPELRLSSILSTIEADDGRLLKTSSSEILNDELSAGDSQLSLAGRRSALSIRRAGLSVEKRALLEEQLRGK